MKLFIDVNKLPRPERSGVISMLVLYLALQGYGDIINAKYAVAAEHWSDLLCYVLPCSLFSHPPEKEQVKPRLKHYRLTPLTFGSGKGKPICACHFDIQHNGQPVQHIHASQENTCDSDWPTEQYRTWQKPEDLYSTSSMPLSIVFLDGRKYSLINGDGAFRFHCTAGKD